MDRKEDLHQRGSDVQERNVSKTVEVLKETCRWRTIVGELAVKTDDL